MDKVYKEVQKKETIEKLPEPLKKEVSKKELTLISGKATFLSLKQALISSLL